MLSNAISSADTNTDPATASPNTAANDFPHAGTYAIADNRANSVPDAIPYASSNAVPNTGADAVPHTDADSIADACANSVPDTVPYTGADAGADAVPDAGTNAGTYCWLS